MTNEPTNKPQSDEFLSSILRRATLSNEARRRHQNLIAIQAASMKETPRRSHLMEIGVIAAIFVAVLTFVVWQLGLPGDNGSTPAVGSGNQTTASSEPVNESAILEPTPPSSGSALPAGSETAMEAADPTPTPRQPGGASEHDAVATAIAQNCQMTPLADTIPSKLKPLSNVATDWMEINGIWVSPPSFFGGSWHAGPGIDTVWYSEDLVLPEQFSAVARSLTDPSISFQFDSSQSVSDLSAGVEAALTEFPEPGCWEIDATIGERQATFTVNVLPFEDRTDVQLFVNVRQAMIPYPAPATCTVSVWNGPQIREGFGIYYWIDNGGIAMRDLSGVFFEGEEELVVQQLGDTRPEIIAWNGSEQYDEANQYVNFELSQTTGKDGDAWSAKTFFPAPGCWQVEVEMEDRIFSAAIYVYPAACRLEEGPVSALVFNGQEVERPEGCVEE